MNMASSGDGRAGSYILETLRQLRMPVVTTLHTILRDPNPDQRRVLDEIVSLSDRVVVMSELGAEFLQTIYHVPAEKIDLIPHGIPDVAFVCSKKIVPRRSYRAESIVIGS